MLTLQKYPVLRPNIQFSASKSRAYPIKAVLPQDASTLTVSVFGLLLAVINGCSGRLLPLNTIPVEPSVTAPMGSSPVLLERLQCPRGRPLQVEILHPSHSPESYVQLSCLSPSEARPEESVGPSSLQDFTAPCKGHPTAIYHQYRFTPGSLGAEGTHDESMRLVCLTVPPQALKERISASFPYPTLNSLTFRVNASAWVSGDVETSADSSQPNTVNVLVATNAHTEPLNTMPTPLHPYSPLEGFCPAGLVPMQVSLFDSLGNLTGARRSICDQAPAPTRLTGPFARIYQWLNQPPTARAVDLRPEPDFTQTPHLYQENPSPRRARDL